LRDGSSRPHHVPHATKAEVVGKIVYLRQSYHFGPDKIAMYLARYHDITVSRSGVWRILKRLEMNRLPASQRYVRHKKRWTRYEKPLPGHQVQVDVKFTRADRPNPAQVLPIHRHRRLHPHPGASCLPTQRSQDGDPVPGLSARAVSVCDRVDPNRRMKVNLSTGRDARERVVAGVGDPRAEKQGGSCKPCCAGSAAWRPM